MTDPTSGGIGKASQQMMEELQKQMQSQTQQLEQQTTQKAQFHETMQAQQMQQTQGVNGTNPVNDVQKVGDVKSGADVLRTAQAQSVNGTTSTPDVKKVEAKAEAKESGFKSMLNQIVDGQNKLDQIIKMATSGKTYGNQELLAIQAAVYKFSNELDLTSKVVEKATSGVKQTMQTQV